MLYAHDAGQAAPSVGPVRRGVLYADDAGYGAVSVGPVRQGVLFARTARLHMPVVRALR